MTKAVKYINRLETFFFFFSAKIAKKLQSNCGYFAYLTTCIAISDTN